MLKLEDIKYPITFVSKCNGMVTFNSPTNAKWDDGEICKSPISHFIKRHNEINPDNIANRDYYYSETKLRNGSVAIFVKEAPSEIKPSLQCTQIESMPVSATLKGVQLDDKSWFEITATPRTIEVYDDIITLLLHYGDFKYKTASGEISIKRGTLVRYEVK